MTLLQCKSSQATKKSNSLWNRSDQVNLRQLLIEYHIYIFVKIQNIFKRNLDLRSKLTKRPKVGLNCDQVLHLVWRQAGPLRGHSVPSDTENSLRLRARCWNSKDYPGHVWEKGKLGFMHLPPKQLVDATVSVWFGMQWHHIFLRHWRHVVVWTVRFKLNYLLWFNPEITLTYFHFSTVDVHLVQKKLEDHQPNKQASLFLSFHSAF